MIPATKYAYDRLWKLNDHADLREYGPDLLLQDVATVVAALAIAERELETAGKERDAARAALEQALDLLMTLDRDAAGHVELIEILDAALEAT